MSNIPLIFKEQSTFVKIRNGFYKVLKPIQSAEQCPNCTYYQSPSRLIKVQHCKNCSSAAEK